MSLKAQQITESGNQPRHGKAKNKFDKKAQHRIIRRKMKNPEVTPQHNRFNGGWVD